MKAHAIQFTIFLFDPLQIHLMVSSMVVLIIPFTNALIVFVSPPLCLSLSFSRVQLLLELELLLLHLPVAGPSKHFSP